MPADRPDDHATECPRCVAERRAGRSLWTGLAVAVSAHFVATADGPRTLWMNRTWDLPRVSLVLVLACVAGANLVLFLRHGRRAVMPLPAPATDPLATYRDGAPMECPRHPYAR